MPIHVLPAEVASQIAAGEVVERPASVVKELVENALDAGAGSIVIELSQAGRSLIQVADDGCGIPAGELSLAVERHATSKLSSASDLFHITTLGFRGEALAAIASVSRLTLTSRTEGAALGARLVVEGGKVGPLEAIGAPVGTLVAVHELFYNVPARLKFLKQDQTERRSVDTLLARYALAYPRVRFQLKEADTTSLQTAGDGDRRAILAALYGVETARALLEISVEEGGLKLNGFLSPVSLTRSNRREITFFINGRWVQDTPLTAALLQAYHTLLMVGRYPLAVLFLEVPPESVDVNVHPAKAEVRFREPDQVFRFVQRSLRQTLLAYTPLSQLGTQATGQEPLTRSGQPDTAWRLLHELGPASQPPFSLSPVLNPPEAQGSLPPLQLIGQFHDTYLLAEGPSGLVLIDQHAAHERVLFEKLMRLHGQKQAPAQVLLTPALVDLTPGSARLLNDQLPQLRSLGFEVDHFGPNTFQLRSLPDFFTSGDPAAALRALVEDFEEDESPLQAEAEARIAGRVCKRLAVKAGQKLSPQEQRALLEGLAGCTSPRTCPHGRPTMIQLSLPELEREFGRRGAR
jgi:DNA mismatch repair protein MutL